MTPSHSCLTKTTLTIMLNTEHWGPRIPPAAWCGQKNKFVFVFKIKITQGKSMDREKGRPRTELGGTLNTFSKLILIGAHVIFYGFTVL